MPRKVAEPTTKAARQSEAPVSVPIAADAAVTATVAPPGMSPLAARVVLEGTPAAHALGTQLADSRPSPAGQAARVVEELTAGKPEALVPLVDRLVSSLRSDHVRVVSACALALPAMARLAPARVARHLPALTASFGDVSPAAQDGLVRTFATLCVASVAYQKRLEPVLDVALGAADAKTLLRWAQIVLPALKGEPHARARAVVERRLPSLPRPVAQKIADHLGIKLRRPVS